MLAEACKMHPVTNLPSARLVMNVENHRLGVQEEGESHDLEHQNALATAAS